MSYFQGLIVEPDCHKCPLQGDKKVFPDGQVPTSLVIVGEGPGGREIEEGRFFVGATGKAQWHLCGGIDPVTKEKWGFSRLECWVTNTALCLPRPVKTPGGITLNVVTVKRYSAFACRRRLIGEIMSVTRDQPNPTIVAVGKLAMEMLTGIKGAIRDYRGSIHQRDLQKMWEEAHKGAIQ